MIQGEGLKLPSKDAQNQISTIARLVAAKKERAADNSDEERSWRSAINLQPKALSKRRHLHRARLLSPSSERPAIQTILSRSTNTRGREAKVDNDNAIPLHYCKPGR